VRPCEALASGVVAGLSFWLVFEVIAFRDQLPADMARAIGQLFDWYKSWSVRNFGDVGFAISNAAVAFQVVAGGIAAVRSRRLSVIVGLFAVSIAGLIFLVGEFIYFGIGSQPLSDLGVACLVVLGQAGLIAVPTTILCAGIGKYAREAIGDWGIFRKTLYTRNLQLAINDKSLSVTLKGVVVALLILVSIGMAARVREEVRVLNEAKIYRVSAERGDNDAQNKLGNLYARGINVAQDDTQAAFWWRKAAEAGNREAAFSLGVMFAKGRGVPQDDTMALYWIRQSAEQGHPGAENELGSLFVSGRGVPQDDAVALQWFLRSAEHGSVAAQDNAGLLYAMGRGTSRDDGKAVEWFRKAAEQGHADAQNNLGIMYQQGRALTKDDGEALRWFLKAAEQGHADAQFQVGLIYEKGQAVGKDEDVAASWFQKAAEKGNSDANQHFQALCDKGLRSACTSKRAMPDVRFRDEIGQDRALAEFRGRVVLLNVWATWCVPCRKEMPALDRLQGQLGGDDFLVVALSIDHDGVEAVQGFYKEIGIKRLGVYVDPSGKDTSALAVQVLPTSFLIDRNGREVARKMGAAEWDGSEPVSLIKGTMNARPTRNDGAR